jgi:hypothetical protein
MALAPSMVLAFSPRQNTASSPPTHLDKLTISHHELNSFLIHRNLLVSACPLVPLNTNCQKKISLCSTLSSIIMRILTKNNRSTATF